MAANATQHRSVRALCEGAIMVALAQILAYLKLYELPQGGSITLAMVPIFFFAVRWGWKKGLGCAFVFGLLQLLLDGGFAIGWQSMLGDYLIAFGVLGLAGIFTGKPYSIFAGTVVGSVARFLVHWVVGATIWAEYMPDEFFGMTMTSPWIYSALYNGSYMLPDMIVSLVAEKVPPGRGFEAGVKKREKGKRSELAQSVFCGWKMGSYGDLFRLVCVHVGFDRTCGFVHRSMEHKKVTARPSQTSGYFF